MNMIKFVKVASSVNDTGVAYYLDWSKMEYIETTATTVILHTLGTGINVSAFDTITITCASGDSLKIADMICQRIGSASQGDLVTVDKDFYGTSITTIIDAVV